MSSYKINAKQISDLHKKIAIAETETNELYAEFTKIVDGAKYMEQLNSIIKKHPVVYDEWLVFLQKAGIEQPTWKADYEPFSISEVQQVSVDNFSHAQQYMSKRDTRLPAVTWWP